MDVFFFCRAAGFCKDPPLEEFQPKWWLDTNGSSGEETASSGNTPSGRPVPLPTQTGTPVSSLGAEEGLAADGLPVALHAQLRHLQSIQQFHLWRLKGLDAQLCMLKAEKLRLSREEGSGSSPAENRGQGTVAPTAAFAAGDERNAEKRPGEDPSQSLSTVADPASQEESQSLSAKAHDRETGLPETRKMHNIEKKRGSGGSPRLEFPSDDRSVSVSTTLPSTPATNMSSCSGTPASFASRSVSREAEGRRGQHGASGVYGPQEVTLSLTDEQLKQKHAEETRGGPGGRERTNKTEPTGEAWGVTSDSEQRLRGVQTKKLSTPMDPAETRTHAAPAVCGATDMLGTEKEGETEGDGGRDRCLGGEITQSESVGKREMADLTTHVTDAGEFYKEDDEKGL
ncbi:hypothetical protein TGGT1_312340 [Toxoplasma gondii GT1]|uniref:Uncharacterized protein n=2 Tax=Toxoplasma gondii TaxID=5811 RepID=S7W1S1_TOXGG|nr:hypothetical protein TGGT1_312340 [Toxoplasma gondii GT1]KAF4639386.1 hypothetical protein TGRH88_051580 [Toxoplasma gondii]